MSASILYPVPVLRERITALEASVTVCLADPDHKPVHKLRTETRRVEAVLLLLDLVSSLPEHRRESASMFRALKKLRRAAGTVRDLDVHRKMLEALSTAEQRATEGPLDHTDSTPQFLESVHSDQKAVTDKYVDSLPEIPYERSTALLVSKAAAELRSKLGNRRDRAAHQLQGVLEKRQTRTVKAAQKLLRTLEIAADASLSADDLQRNAELLLTRDGLLNVSVDTLDEEELHNIRKAAKKARYLAELLPGDPTLVRTAERFEALQEAGGQWHDALQLARAARRRFGKAHELAVLYKEDRDRKLATYRAALTAESVSEKQHFTPLTTRQRQRFASSSRPSGRTSVRRNQTAVE